MVGIPGNTAISFKISKIPKISKISKNNVDETNMSKFLNLPCGLIS